MKNSVSAAERQFVEEMGLVFEQTGLPRMSGRIFGWLVIAHHPQQSAEDIAQALLVSKGAISSMTRLLIQTGLIERFSLPGVRRDYFRLRADASRQLIRHGIEEELRMVRCLAEHGLKLLADKAPAVRKHLQEMKSLYSFLERKFPALLRQWEQKHKRETSVSPLS